jgi:ADP-heptose:LPS heptosyltransferase
MWEENHWSALAHGLLENPKVELLLPGTAGERDRVERVRAKILERAPSAVDRVKNLAGTTDLSQVIGLLAGCHLVVGVDSGVMHLAAWTGVPTITLFGPETPGLYAPYSRTARVLSAELPCSPCLTVAAEKITRCRDNQCMKRIPPGQVLKACREVLSPLAQTGARQAGP